jgi:N-acetylglucosamine-6-phosphate deacetylase
MRGEPRLSETLAFRGTVITPKEEIPDGIVIVDGEKIKHVGPWKEGRYERLLDLRGHYIAPGLVDIHVHGGGGHDAMSAEGLEGLSRFLAGGGVTSFLPTTRTAPHEELLEAAAYIGRGIEGGVSGATPLGVNMEGPYINPEMSGAQNAAHVRSPDTGEMEEVDRASGGRLRVVTLAPEAERALEAIHWLSSKGVVPAAGHTDSSYETMEEAIDAGLCHASHVFNRMSPFNHREPGASGAALADDRVTVELVADGFHLHPATLRIASRVKGPGKVALVSDSIPPAGLPDGEHVFGGLNITVSEGRSLLESGRLAGSTITLADAVRNMVRLARASLPEAVEMASTTPARIAGASGRKGCLVPGMDADITVLDGDFIPAITVVGGEIVYRRS